MTSCICSPDALSDFLSACWTSKLVSSEGGRGPSRKTISPKARNNGEGSCSTIHESRFHPAPSPGRLYSHYHRCCHRCYYHNRHHFRRHHHHHHHHYYHFHRCSRTSASNSSGGGAFATSETSSTFSLSNSNRQPPKLILTPAPFKPIRRFGRSCSLPVPSDISLKHSRFFCQDSSEGSRLRSK